MRRGRWALLLFVVALLLAHRFLFLGTVEVGRDLFRLFIPESAYLRDQLLQGNLPLWNPLVRLGQPFAATIYPQVFYPPRVLAVLLLGPIWGVQAMIVFHAGLASLGAYFASRRLGAGRWGGVLAGAFGFTPFFTHLAASLHVVSALAWSGWIVVAALSLARRPRLSGAAWLAVCLGLSFLCGAPEMLLWQAALAVGLASASRTPRRSLGFALLALIWSGALAAITALPALELTQFFKGPDAGFDALDWSTSPAQLLAMFWPLADQPVSTEFFGRDQAFVTLLFVGSSPGLLALFALRRSRKIQVLAVVALGCAALCLGRYFLPARLLLAVPPFALFRYPVKYVFGLAFCVALLSGQGLRRLTALARRMQPQLRTPALALGAGLALIVVLQLLAGLAPWRTGMRPGALWFGLIATVLGVAFAALGGPGRRARWARAAVLALALLEVGAAQLTLGFEGLVAPGRLSTPSTLAAQIRAEQHGRTSIDIEDLIHPEKRAPGSDDFVADSRQNLASLRPLEESLSMLEGYGFRQPWRLVEAMDGSPRAPYDVFGVTHFVRHSTTPPFPDLEPMDGAGTSHLFRSRSAFWRAWLVQTAVVASDEESLRVLRTDSHTLVTKGFLEHGAAIEGPACASLLSLSEPNPQSLRIELDACARSYLVIADSFFPGWVAHVGDEEREIIRADYLLRAIEVPAGHSTVRLEYRPWSFRLGAFFSALGWLIALAVLLGAKMSSKSAKTLKNGLSSR